MQPGSSSVFHVRGGGTKAHSELDPFVRNLACCSIHGVPGTFGCAQSKNTFASVAYLNIMVPYYRDQNYDVCWSLKSWLNEWLVPIQQVEGLQMRHIKQGFKFGITEYASIKAVLRCGLLHGGVVVPCPCCFVPESLASTFENDLDRMMRVQYSRIKTMGTSSASVKVVVNLKGLFWYEQRLRVAPLSFWGLSLTPSDATAASLHQF